MTAPWTCWVCGATHAKNGKPLMTDGRSSINHLRSHAYEGLVRQLPVQRRKDKAVFVLTAQGEAYVEAQQRQEVPALAPQLPSRGTMLRRIYDLIGEYPGVRITAQEIADECDVYLRKASAFAHTLAKRGLVQMESGGRGRQSEFWVDA